MALSGFSKQIALMGVITAILCTATSISFPMRRAPFMENTMRGLPGSR